MYDLVERQQKRLPVKMSFSASNSFSEKDDERPHHTIQMDTTTNNLSPFSSNETHHSSTPQSEKTEFSHPDPASNLASLPRSTRTRPPASAITMDQGIGGESNGVGSDGQHSLSSEKMKDSQSDRTRVQRDDLGIFMPVLPNHKKAPNSATGSPVDSFNRKPWSRPISSPYGAANKMMSNSYASSTNSPIASGTPVVGAAGSAFIDDHDPGRWHTDAKEHDDYLHDPEKPVQKSSVDARGILNVGTLCILITAILMLFMGYPLLTRFYFDQEGKKGGYGLGGTNMTGQVPDLASLNMRQSLVDSDTPNTALEKQGLGPAGTETWDLVFSDEFNVDGRSFYPGDDPIWEAHNLYAHGTGDYEWYDPAAITTKGGALQITVIQDQIHNLNFRSGQLTSWNKFCFTGGYLEASVILPGNPEVSGWWPAIWTMGNLGRANYGATTDGTWPYSYNTCDRGTLINQTDANGLGPAAAINSGGETTFNNKYHTTDLSWQPGQRLSACTCPGDDHPGPKNSDGSYVGRSAPEIDMFEAQVDQNLGGSLSLSCQFMPASAGYYLANATGNEYTRNIIHGERVELNTYRGSILQMAASGVARTNQQSYQNTGQVYSVWGFEYEPGDNGYITWWMDGVKAWTLTAAAVGPDTLAGIAQRPIPEEPMYIIMNVAISSGFGTIQWDQLQYPATMQVDYVRLYQSKDRQNVGCDPEGYPTADYINRHWDAYNNPNYTVWGGDQATGGYGANWPRNRLYNDGNGCAEAPRNYPGRLRPNGINQSPASTVPTRYSGSTANQDDSSDE